MKVKLLTKLKQKAFAKSVAKEIEKTALALYKEDLTKSNYERIMKNLSSKMPVTPTAPHEDTSSDTCGTLQKVQEERNYWRSKALELAMDVGKVPKRLDPFKGKTSQDWDDVIPREEVIDALNLAPWEYSDIQKHRLKKRSTGEEIRIYQAGPKFALFKKVGTGWQPFSDFRYFINLLLEAGDSGYSLRD